MDDLESILWIILFRFLTLLRVASGVVLQFRTIEDIFDFCYWDPTLGRLVGGTHKTVFLYYHNVLFKGYTPVNKLIKNLRELFRPRYPMVEDETGDLEETPMTEVEEAKIKTPDEVLKYLREAIDSNLWPNEDTLLDPKHMDILEKAMGSQRSLTGALERNSDRTKLLFSTHAARDLNIIPEVGRP